VTATPEQPYESCVTGADGRCNRWSHNHPDPTPQPVPGSVAIATVRGVEGVRVWSEPSVLVERPIWHSIGRVGPDAAHPDHEVTVTSRAVVVTEADAEEHALATRREFGHESERWFREWFAALLEGGASGG
jgi:hypothetical protein